MLFTKPASNFSTRPIQFQNLGRFHTGAIPRQHLHDADVLGDDAVVFHRLQRAALDVQLVAVLANARAKQPVVRRAEAERDEVLIGLNVEVHDWVVCGDELAVVGVEGVDDTLHFPGELLLRR